MTFATGDRVKETSTSTGTGAFTLAGAPTNYRMFASICANGDQVRYAIVHQTVAEWESGLGTWGTGGILTRSVVEASSNAGAAVNFSAGTKDVFNEFTAEQSQFPVTLRVMNGDVTLPVDSSLTLQGPFTAHPYTLTVPSTTYAAFR
jgi:hypothetical protein